MNDEFGVAEARAIAEAAHAGQLDKAGRPYMEHVSRVANAVSRLGEDHELVALLHDVVEDTKATFDDLARLRVPPRILAALDAITKRAGEPYDFSVSRAAADPLARAVKLADNADNSREDRLVLLDPRTAAGLRDKYARARRLLR